MAVANLHNEGVNIDTGNDSIVIIDNFRCKRGGATLDATGYALDVLKAGHIIIKETASGTYKPMPVSGAAYAAIPVGHSYEGVLRSSILTAKPFAAIMDLGTVNEVASPYAPTAEAKAALSGIKFIQD